MRVIDLLNKIANREELPKKIKWGCHYLEWIDYDKDYIAVDELGKPTLFETLKYLFYNINDEVEIIEEPQEHKIPEKLSYILDGNDIAAFPNNEMLMNKINEILDYLEEENE